MKANQVYFSGNLGKNSEVKNYNGKPYTRFSVCQTKKWKQGNDWKEKQIWVSVVIWESLPGFKKGDNILVVGELDYNTWEDKSKVKHSALSVKASEILYVPKKETQDNSQSNSQDDFPY